MVRLVVVGVAILLGSAARGDQKAPPAVLTATPPEGPFDTIEAFCKRPGRECDSNADRQAVKPYEHFPKRSAARITAVAEIDDLDPSCDDCFRHLAVRFDDKWWVVAVREPTFVGMEHFQIDEVEARGARVLIRYSADVSGKRIGIKWDGVVVCGPGATGKLGCVGPLKTKSIQEWYATGDSDCEGARVNYRCRADLRDGDILELTRARAKKGEVSRGDAVGGPVSDGPQSCEELPFWGRTRLTFP
jgi:hypothetical protein